MVPRQGDGSVGLQFPYRANVQIAAGYSRHFYVALGVRDVTLQVG